jgi:hypothetical protein
VSFTAADSGDRSIWPVVVADESLVGGSAGSTGTPTVSPELPRADTSRCHPSWKVTGVARYLEGQGQAGEVGGGRPSEIAVGEDEAFVGERSPV